MPMRSQLSSSFSSLVLGTILVLGACTPDPAAQGGTDAASGNTGGGACIQKSDCATGEVCSAGVCIPGDCQVREDCPRPRDQLCSEFFRCVPDPDSPIGDECPAGDNDCDLGEFCSAGNCYDTENRPTCLTSSQCTSGDRCDPEAGYCVPNLGGCDRCADYPELCCVPEEETCDSITKKCIPVGGIRCTPETVEEDCRPGERCVSNRCVQCETDDDCGPGTTCDTGSGQCVSAAVCQTDADCAQWPGRRCAVATHQCTVPQCQADSACTGIDPRQRCNLETFQCFLPAADCNETNEPNDSQATATAMTQSGDSYVLSGTLCRGNQDWLSFPVVANRRVQAVISMAPAESGAAAGIGVALYGPAGGSELSSSTFGYSTTSKRLSGNVDASGTAFLRINGTGTDEDSWTYTVEVTFTDPLLCDTEPGEPNNTLATATNSVVMGGVTTRALCGDTDEDHHTFHASPNKRIRVQLDYDEPGSLGLTLYTPGGSVLDDPYGWESIAGSTDTGAEGADIVVAVSYSTFFEPTEDALVYTLTITEEDVPTCDDLAMEPNNTQAQAFDITPGTITGVSCENGDNDWYTFTLNRSSPVKLTLSFGSSYDLDLRLYDDDGFVDSSAVSDNPEVIDQDNLPAGNYYVEVDPFTFNEDSYPISYTLQLEAPGFCTDDALDNDPGNDTRYQASGIRDVVEGSLFYESSLHMCRQDEDWFRLVALGDERITATLTDLPSALITVYAPGGSTGVVELARSHLITIADEQAQIVTTPVDAPAGIYYVKVSGGASLEGPYSLQIRTDVDVCETLGGDDESNDAPANAIMVTAGVNGGIFCPADDVDIWRVQAQVNPDDPLTASATFDSAEGDVDLEIWQAGQAQPIASDVDTETGAQAVATVSHTVTVATTYYIVVKRKPGGTVGQQYSLEVTGFVPPGGSSSSSGGSSTTGGSSSGGGSTSSSASSSSGGDTSTSSSASSSTSSSSSGGADTSTSSSASSSTSSSASSSTSSSASSSTSSSSSGGADTSTSSSASSSASSSSSSSSSSSGGTPVAEDCAAAGDEDSDGFENCADQDCFMDAACLEAELEDCTNGSDDLDTDNLSDCADPECYNHASCVGETDCTNGSDDADLDDLVDCADTECMGKAGVCGG
ncbi:MAG: pre-peptidase C-terminal domain-containing protein [Myxococcota bacterium]